MASIWLYSIISVLVVSLVSLVGIVVLSIKEKDLRGLLLYFVSFSAGGLLGDTFIHLLPEAVEDIGFTLGVSVYVLSGIAISFIVEKLIHWRHCHIPHSKEHYHPFAIMNLFGDAVHNFIDGVIIAGSYLVSFPLGIATTLAVIFHEIPQEIGDFMVLIYGGYTKYKALLFNFISASTAILGAILALALSQLVENLTGFLIPFAAGSFIYIAGSDFIPELHKETNFSRSFVQLIVFIFGMGIMLALRFFE